LFFIPAGGGAFYAHGHPNEMCQQADGRPAHEQGKMALPYSILK